MSVIEKWVPVVCPGCGAPARARVQHIIAWGSIPGTPVPHRVSVLCEHRCAVSRDDAVTAVHECPECNGRVA
ncbi:hypothetical protein [Cellulosimicrobium composti]|uniref:HNH endonuclease n=1 Tax=Cellulosimicrobium composti TaxID=2672572 RepID=A0ABX0B5W3_9MICO|nr:hypothetical protein [Cellulosimicrobium composti]NDO88012.1 hypothetical protein [Cellulosimicrobium composti]TWG85375.1 hypothetical protein L603_001900000490 [Cellulosimicrobium cellulans J34]SMF24396.1 hypothetical protein SAMN02744115_02178 [Cellulosimicrobium cellulans J1]